MKAELVTEKMVAYGELLSGYFNQLSQKFPGTLTLNEMRIAHAVMMGTLTDGSTDNTSLSKALGISKATVSRAIQRLVEAGLYRETVHPLDHRRRVLEFTDQGRQQAREWLNWINQI